MRVELELRNLPRLRILDYLVEAGGQPTGELSVAGAGWTAVLVPLEPAEITPILRVPRDLLVIEGDDEAVDRVKAHMRHKTMRGGG